MALTHEFTLLCEHARLEIGGKFTIIGYFPNGIGVTQIPFSMPLLTFFSLLKADQPGAYGFRASLRLLEGGAPLAQANGKIQATQAGPIPMPFPIPNLRFMAHGIYTWAIQIDGQEDHFLTQFQVVVVPPHPLMPNLVIPRF